MIIPNKPRLSTAEERELAALVSDFGVRLQKISGTHRSVYAMLGDERHELLISRVEGLSFIDRVDAVQQPYKLMAKTSELAGHQVRVGEHAIDPRVFTVIAGHCTIDPAQREMFLDTAHAVKEAGAHVLRGGVWKPRTSPHSYQGDARALQILIDAKTATGLPVNTECMDAEQLDLALEAGVDMIQIGARNALNYSLLKKLGKRMQRRPVAVLLKRGLHMGKLDEFILAAEYIVAAGGNPNVLLCPRGTLPSLDGYRNHPDESITPLLKARTWAPVVVDPSHSVGLARYVPYACLAAASYRANGIVVETHIKPLAGIGDDPKQAITPAVLADTIRKTQAIHALHNDASGDDSVSSSSTPSGGASSRGASSQGVSP